MKLHPLLSGLIRRRAMTLLLVSQLALVLAIASNTLSGVQYSLQKMHFDAGYEIDNLFGLNSNFLHKRGGALLQQAQQDLALLRAIEGVASATDISHFPISGGGSYYFLRSEHSWVATGAYFGDEQMLNTLDLELIAGRDFQADEVRWTNSAAIPNVVILSQSAARKFFPNEEALGKVIYPGDDDANPIQIVGIVKAMLGENPLVGHAFDTALFPVVSNYGRYLVRAEPGRRDRLMERAPAELLKVEPDRIMRVENLEQNLSLQLQSERNSLLSLSVVSLVIFAITAFSVLGITHYDMQKRHQQIGTRRALGATRWQIIQYFLLENVVVSSLGILLGLAAAFVISHWLVRSFSMVSLNLNYLWITAALIYLVGQLAVLYPAIKAARISPAIATRSV